MERRAESGRDELQALDGLLKCALKIRLLFQPADFYVYENQVLVIKNERLLLLFTRLAPAFAMKARIWVISGTSIPLHGQLIPVLYLIKSWDQ